MLRLQARAALRRLETTCWSDGERPVAWINPLGTFSLTGNPRRWSRLAHACWLHKELLGYFLKDVHYDEDCIWQEKGVQENSDTEAKNLNKWDLNNRFS